MAGGPGLYEFSKRSTNGRVIPDRAERTMKIQQPTKDFPSLKLKTGENWIAHVNACVKADPRVDLVARALFAQGHTNYSEFNDRFWEDLPDYEAPRTGGYIPEASKFSFRAKAIIALEAADAAPGPKRRRPPWAKAIDREPALTYGAAKEVRDE